MGTRGDRRGVFGRDGAHGPRPARAAVGNPPAAAARDRCVGAPRRGIRRARRDPARPRRGARPRCLRRTAALEPRGRRGDAGDARAGGAVGGGVVAMVAARSRLRGDRRRTVRPAHPDAAIRTAGVRRRDRDRRGRAGALVAPGRGGGRCRDCCPRRARRGTWRRDGEHHRVPRARPDRARAGGARGDRGSAPGALGARAGGLRDTAGRGRRVLAGLRLADVDPRCDLLGGGRGHLRGCHEVATAGHRGARGVRAGHRLERPGTRAADRDVGARGPPRGARCRGRNPRGVPGAGAALPAACRGRGVRGIPARGELGLPAGVGARHGGARTRHRHARARQRPGPHAARGDLPCPRGTHDAPGGAASVTTSAGTRCCRSRVRRC